MRLPRNCRIPKRPIEVIIISINFIINFIINEYFCTFQCLKLDIFIELTISRGFAVTLASEEINCYFDPEISSRQNH